MPLQPLREELDRLLKQTPELWDGRVSNIQVTDVSEKCMQLRVLISASNASKSWDLRCFLRENLLQFIVTHYADYLPKWRTDIFQVNNLQDNASENSATKEVLLAAENSA
ncbi:MAG: hypothetical protein EOO68_34575 [Moraxellaceae bacterium]|nr:MAG: hypothetical protein EOO68_34575 [Moraxellaceae bacterium]